MTRDELEHAIRAACDVAEDEAVYVFGSQAILGQFPDAPAALRQSAEVDVAPYTRHDRADAIDGALGELSQFHRVLLVERLIRPATLMSRIRTLDAPAGERERMLEWVRLTATGLRAVGGRPPGSA